MCYANAIGINILGAAIESKVVSPKKGVQAKPLLGNKFVFVIKQRRFKRISEKHTITYKIFRTFEAVASIWLNGSCKTIILTRKGDHHHVRECTAKAQESH